MNILENKLVVAFLALALLLCLCHHAKAEEYQGPHHFNVVFTPEATAQEVVWQALNVVDAYQTVYIANHPAQYMEVGQAGIVCGDHPSKGAAIATMAGFAVLHYAVTVGLENLVQTNPDYRVLQRVWEYTTIGLKVAQIAQNHAYGIKP